MQSQEKKFSPAWKHSTQPRRQRAYLYAAPLHHLQKLLHVHLAPALRQKFQKRSVQIRKGDTVRIMRGQFAKKEAKVERIDLHRQKIFVEGMHLVKKEGTKIPSPLRPSQLMLVSLELQDPRRKSRLERSAQEEQKEKKEKT